MITKSLRLVYAAALALTGTYAGLAQEQPDIAAAPAPIEEKRIMGVLPNYRTADGTLPFHPISAKYKLTIAAKDSFDGPNYVIGALFAGIYQLQNQHPSFGQGMKGYAHRYATSYGDQIIGNMLSEGFMPVLLHEDPRYFRKVNGNVWKRTGYSLTRVLITKTDSGKSSFNFAEVMGNGIGSTIANAYYPDERGVKDTLGRMTTQIATDALSNLLKEFWPDVKKRMHRNDSNTK